MALEHHTHRTQDVPASPRRRVWRRMAAEIIAPGLVAGWVAGLAMLIAAMIVAAATGRGVWNPLRLVSAFIFGDDALQMGAGAVILGAVVHFAVAGAWGVFFNAMLPRGVTLTWAFGMALIFALGVHLLMTWLVLPWMNPLLFRTVSTGVLLVYHLIFGAVLPLALPLRRSIHARHLQRAHA